MLSGFRSPSDVQGKSKDYLKEHFEDIDEPIAKRIISAIDGPNVPHSL